VYGGLVLIWTIVPAFVTTMGSLVVTDIVKETCVPWGAYTSYVAEKALSSILVSFTFLVPMILTVFCYSRIVYTIVFRKVSLSARSEI